MIMAETGGTLSVTGKKRAIPATGPSPGRSPTKVPIQTPPKQYKRFSSVKITENPYIRPPEISMNFLHHFLYKSEPFLIANRPI